MVKRSSKHRNTIPISFSLSQGENLADSNHAIGDNEAARLYNFIYRVGSKIPIVRPAIRQVTVTNDFSTPITTLHTYVKDASTSYLIAVSGDNLYYLSGTTWTLISALESGSEPQMITFNGSLLVADGNSGGIGKWTGAAWSRIAGSPEATAIIEHENRVCANNANATGLDEVDFSKVEDETGWTYTAGGGAVRIRAGYGDGLLVNSLSSMFGNVIVSKTSIQYSGKGARMMYRVATGDSAYDAASAQTWKAEELFPMTSAFTNRCMITADNNTYYLADEGFCEIVATDRYADLSNRQIGAKVNRALELRVVPNYWGLYWIPLWGCVAIFQKENREAHLYWPWLTDPSGYRTGGFSRIGMSTVIWHAITQFDDKIYLAGSDGYLYQIGTDNQYQDTPAGVATTIAADWESKNFDFGYEGLVKRCETLYEPLTDGTLTIKYRNNEASTDVTAVNAAAFETSDIDLYEWTDDFGGLSTDLATYPEQDLVKIQLRPKKNITRAKYRSGNLSIIGEVSGRIGLTGQRGTVALVGE